MKLSQNTIDILKNLSGINLNLAVNKGSTLKTISEAKNITASAEIAESFSTDFGIYNLSEFISVFDLLPDPEIEFTHDRAVFRSGRSSATYRFADASILTKPTKDLVMPPSDVSFIIDSATLNQIRSAARTFKHTILSVNRESDKVANLSVVDPKNPAANSFTISIDTTNSQSSQYDVQFLIANLKMIPGDYEVDISAKGISRWSQLDGTLLYHIAIEKTSSFSI